MGDLVKLTPYSEVTATLEILDRLGVRREHLANLRSMSSWFQQQIAGALISGSESFFSIIPVPSDNVEFELTLTPAEVDPIQMVRADGYNPTKWKFKGEAITEPVTKTFVHLNLGYCRDLADAKAKTETKGYELADGRFRVAYRREFPKPTRPIAVIFGDSGWSGPDGGRNVPYLSGRGEAWFSNFRWSGDGLYGDCRWLASRELVLEASGM